TPKFWTSQKLVLKLVSLVLDSLVNLFKQCNRFTTTMRTLLTTGNFALRTTQLRFCSLIPTRVWNRLVVRHGCKFLQTNFHSDFLAVCRKRLRFTLDRETGVPLATLTLDCDGLDLAADRTMQLHFDWSDALHAQHVVMQLDAIPVTWERDATEATTTFESRVASFLTTFHSAKERFVSLVHAAENILAAGKVCQPQVASGTNLFQLIGLGVVVDRNSLFPRITTFLQRRIVQATGFVDICHSST